MNETEKLEELMIYVFSKMGGQFSGADVGPPGERGYSALCAFGTNAVMHRLYTHCEFPHDINRLLQDSSVVGILDNNIPTYGRLALSEHIKSGLNSIVNVSGPSGENQICKRSQLSSQLSSPTFFITMRCCDLSCYVMPILQKWSDCQKDAIDYLDNDNCSLKDYGLITDIIHIIKQFSQFLFYSRRGPIGKSGFECICSK